MHVECGKCIATVSENMDFLRALVSAIQSFGQRCWQEGFCHGITSRATTDPHTSWPSFIKLLSSVYVSISREGNETSVRWGLMFWKLDTISIQPWRSSPSLLGSMGAGLSMEGWRKGYLGLI